MVPKKLHQTASEYITKEGNTQFKHTHNGKITPENWEIFQFGQLLDIRSGKGFRLSEYVSEGIKLLRIDNVSWGNVTWESIAYLPSPYADEYPELLLKEGDILLALNRPITQGKLKLAILSKKDVPAILYQRVGKLLFKDNKLDESFTYYLLQHFLPAFIINRSVGSDQPFINITALRKLQLLLPSLPEQKKIAAILSSVDEAIASTQAVINQTGKVKQGLLQQLLTKGIGHTRFKESEFGKIPETWEVVELKQLLSKAVQNGYSPVCPKDPTGHWILSLGAVSPDGLDPASVKPAPINDLKVFEFSLEPGDFLISRSNTRERVGFSALFRGEIENCSYPDLLMRFRINNNMMLNDFLEIYLSSSTALGYLQNAAAGTSGSMVKITKSVVEKLQVPIPSISEQQQICEALLEIQKAAKYAHQGLESLRKTKSGLMQDLLTGRVRVGGTP